jgi:hypothetical protein
VNRSDSAISPYGRAACPVCGSDISLTKKEVMRYHLGGISIGGYRQVCEGVGRIPGDVAPSVTAESPAPPQPAVPSVDRRRRLEADIEDAKKTLWNAQAYFDRLCNELAELARVEREARHG